MSTTSFGLRWSGRTDRGKVRKNNEDAFLAVRMANFDVQLLGKEGELELGDTPFAFAVSDGMGGARAGEYASRIAVDKLTKMLPVWHGIPLSEMSAKSTVLFNRLFDDIHRALCYLGSSYEECSGMEATFSLIWFSGSRVFFAHIGDTRIYHWEAASGQFRQLTEDDTHVGWLYMTVRINEREARSHPRRHILQKALGGQNQFVTPQVGEALCQPGDRFLVCSDGVTEELYDRDIIEILEKPVSVVSNPADALVEAVLARGAKDNVTAVVIDFV